MGFLLRERDRTVFNDIKIGKELPFRDNNAKASCHITLSTQTKEKGERKTEAFFSESHRS